MRRTGLFSAVAGISLLLSSVGTASSAGGIVQPSYPAYTKNVTITWWSWTLNNENLIKAFEKKYPTIHVVWHNIGASQTEYTKLETVIKAGSGAPDLVQLQDEIVPQFAASGGLRDLAPLGANRYRSYFLPWVWDQMSEGNAVYAIPEDIGQTALFYNTKIFQKYGLTLPKTWKDFLADAAKLHKANPHVYMTWFDYADGPWFMSLAWAAGARPFAQTGANSWKINLTSPAMQRVTQLWGQMTQQSYAQPIAAWSADWVKNLSSGLYASFIGCAWSPSYELNYLKPGAGWHVAPMPQFTPSPYVTGNWEGSANAVTTQSKNPDAALLFAAWINTNAQAIHTDILSGDQGGRGLWPADQSAQNSPDLNSPVPILDGQRVGTVFGSAAKAVGRGFQWSPWMTYLYSRFGVESGKAVNGQESWQQAMANVQAAVIQYAKQQGYSVTS